ncbi:MAG: hypothetical protein HY688_00690 [Chloroflexi bacterium]|nr:hypothetical protein [Chloroflexota bacterium]
MLDEREESRRRGSDHTWYVLEEHCIDNGVLKDGRVWPGGRAVVGHRREYFPFAHPELVPAFSRLLEGDEGGVLTFANKWGLLGYDGLIHLDPGRIEWSPYAEPPWKWFASEADRQGGFLDIQIRPVLMSPAMETRPGAFVIRRAERKDGDPLPWIWAHAETVRRLLRLIALLKEGTEGDIDRYLDRIAVERRVPRRRTDILFSLFQVAVGIDPQEEVETDIRPPRGHSFSLNTSAMDEARQLLSRVIDGNLRDVRPSVTTPYPRPREGTRLQRSLSFSALLSVIYWHVSESAIGQRAYRQCAECDKWFEQKHGLQNYCPPDLEGTESQCAVRARQRRFIADHPDYYQKYRARRTLAKGGNGEQAREQ